MRDNVVLGTFLFLKQRSVCVAVCVTGCTGVTQWQLGEGVAGMLMLRSLREAECGPTCMHLTHVVSLCAVRVCEVWGFLCYSQLLRHLRDGRNRSMTKTRKEEEGARYHFFKREKE